jgi:hypothetical protein
MMMMMMMMMMMRRRRRSVENQIEDTGGYACSPNYRQSLQRCLLTKILRSQHLGTLHCTHTMDLTFQNFEALWSQMSASTRYPHTPSSRGVSQHVLPPPPPTHALTDIIKWIEAIVDKVGLEVSVPPLCGISCVCVRERARDFVCW